MSSRKRLSRTALDSELVAKNRYPLTSTSRRVLRGAIGEQVRVVGGRRVSDGLRAAAARVAHVEREQLQLVRREAVLVAHHVAVHRLRRSQSAGVRHGVPVHLERVADAAVHCRTGTHVPRAGILLVDTRINLKNLYSYDIGKRATIGTV